MAVISPLSFKEVRGLTGDKKNSSGAFWKKSAKYFEGFSVCGDLVVSYCGGEPHCVLNGINSATAIYKNTNYVLEKNADVFFFDSFFCRGIAVLI